MSAINVNTYYQTSQVNTASRIQLLLMVYDGIIRFLTEGKRSMAANQVESQNTALKKAQDLVIELIVTIDPGAFPELANNLQRMYDALYNKIVWANINDDQDALDHVISVFATLRETWAEADIVSRSQETSRRLEGAGV